MRSLPVILVVLVLTCGASAQHHAGENCSGCHAAFSLGGTVFAGYDGDAVEQGTALALFRSDGSRVTLPPSDEDGRVYATAVEEGDYLMQIGALRSRSWHVLPAQKDCNSCHVKAGNMSPVRDRLLTALHPELPAGNDCTPCHHYPASMRYARLATPGQLSGAERRPATQGAAMVIGSQAYPFDPAEYEIETLRPDIFADGYFSMLDVILAVTRRQGIPVVLHWDPDCQTHFIDSVNGVGGDFWYHFSYDAGNGTQGELRYRRQIRWDELLWQPGAWVRLTLGEDVPALRQAFREEIARERASGHVVSQVQISINPSNYRGNPPESHRITVSRSFRDVAVTAHDLRAVGGDSLYRRPFRRGVVTAMDLLFSLQDQGEIDLVGTAYFTHLAGKVMESYRVRALGFPGEGLAHASGRQGFVYSTGNGTPQQLINDADGKQHVHADIHVIHAPDFARWRWIELGNPYYEDDEPTGVEEMLADYEAHASGFRLQRPWPQPASGAVSLSFNVFTPGRYRITLHDLAGRRLRVLFDAAEENVGVRQLPDAVSGLTPGIYFVRMTDGRHTDVQKIVVDGK